jgi:hypothetical protein
MTIYKKATPEEVTRIREEFYLHRAELKKIIYKRDNKECQKCGFSPYKHYYNSVDSEFGFYEAPRLEIDHIIPVSLGGNNDLSNLQVLCQKCNQAKRTRVGNDWEFKKSHIMYMMMLDYDIRKKKALKRVRGA